MSLYRAVPLVTANADLVVREYQIYCTCTLYLVLLSEWYGKEEGAADTWAYQGTAVHVPYVPYELRSMTIQDLKLEGISKGSCTCTTHRHCARLQFGALLNIV